MTGLTHTREYIRDLATGSAATQIINNDFARNAKDLMVYSFCETLPTISGSSNLIVDKASAILGMCNGTLGVATKVERVTNGSGLHPKNEHIQYLRANHRDICKFRSVTDSNYLILKNALATAVEDLIRNGKDSKRIVILRLTCINSCYKKRFRVQTSDARRSRSFMHTPCCRRIS